MTTFPALRHTFLWVCLLGLPIAAFWMGERFLEARNVSKDYHSQSRFAQIRAMLLLYHEEHGAFPSTRYQPEAGGPIHSWRVLLVPHTDADFRERFSSYDFSQEWSSPDNLRALDAMPYFDYFTTDGDAQFTDYLAIGDGDEWPSRKPLSPVTVSSLLARVHPEASGARRRAQRRQRRKRGARIRAPRASSIATEDGSGTSAKAPRRKTPLSR